MPDPFPLDLDVLREVADYLNIGIYVTDLKRRIVLWNRKAEEVTGHRAKDIIGQRCADNVLSHVDKNGDKLCGTDLCPLYRAMQTGKDSGEPILVYARKADGKRVPVLVTTAPLRDKQGNIVGGVETFRDAGDRIRDLEMAQRVQEHMLPHDLPATDAIRFNARYCPHSEVGGDFYDVLLLPGDRYGILVSDVNGHGVSAALYTMLLKGLMENHKDVAGAPAEFMAALNQELSGFMMAGGFASASYLLVDVRKDKVTYVNAGHPPPFQFHPDSGTVDQLQAEGIVLGVSPDYPYESLTTSFAPGDVLLCYSDGATEVENAERNMLGIEGLADLFVAEAKKSTSQLPDRLYRRVCDYCHDVALPDDILLLSAVRF